MRERPGGDELLTVARDVLLKELLPLLPDDRRYDTLMIANAMGIAARQIALGDDFEETERRELEVLVGKADLVEGAEKDGDKLTALYRTLCTRIRGGDFDPGTPGHAALGAFLRDVTVRRLRESAPKVLEQTRGK